MRTCGAYVEPRNPKRRNLPQTEAACQSGDVVGLVSNDILAMTDKLPVAVGAHATPSHEGTVDA